MCECNGFIELQGQVACLGCFSPPKKYIFALFPFVVRRQWTEEKKAGRKIRGLGADSNLGLCISLKGTLITCFTQTSALTQAFKQTKQSRKKINVYIQKAVTSNSLSDLSPDHKISWMDAWMRTFGVIILFA